MRGLPEMVGFAVGVGNTVVGSAIKTPHAPLIYRAAVAGFGVYRAFSDKAPTANSLDITYALICAPVALEAIFVPGAIKGGGIRALGQVIPVEAHDHADEGDCSYCLGARAEALRTPPESLRGY